MERYTWSDLDNRQEYRVQRLVAVLKLASLPVDKSMVGHMELASQTLLIAAGSLDSKAYHLDCKMVCCSKLSSHPVACKISSAPQGHPLQPVTLISLRY